MTAPLLTNAAAYFRAAIAGTNATAAVLNFNGGIKAQSFTGSVNSSNVTGLGALALSNRMDYSLIDNAPTNTAATQTTTIFGGCSTAAIAAGALQYFPVGYNTGSTPTTEARVIQVPYSGYLSNFWFRTYSVSALGAGTNLNFTLLTNAICGNNPTQCGVIASLPGNGSATFISASNLTTSIRVVQGGNICVMVTNTAAVSTPSTGLFWNFTLYKNP